MNSTMKAALITHYKQATPTIQNVPVPEVGPNDVLVKIMAASINPIDLKTKDGDLRMLLKYKMPLILGSDFAGTITQIGSQVTDFKVGDAVYGRPQDDHIGTFAEYIAVDQSDIAHKPQNLSFEEAAAIPLVSLTSYQALHDLMSIQPNQKVLIQAGSGGVGTIAIQLAKQLGAFVATTTSTKNIDLVRSLGADQVIDYKQTQFDEVLFDYDYVFDTLGGESLEKAFKIVKPGGKIVSIAGMPNARFAKAFGLPIWKQLLIGAASHKLTKLETVHQVQYDFLFMKPSGQELEVIRQLIEADKLHPIIDRIVDFSDLPAAFTYSHSGRAKGKIIIKMTDLQA